MGFADILNKPAEEIVAPPAVPSGWYDLIVKKYEPVEMGQKKTEALRFTFGILQPHDEVDEGELEEFGGIAKLRETTVIHNFFMTESSAYRLREFLENACQINLSGRSMGQGLTEVTNVQVRAKIGRRPDPQDPKRMFTEIKEFVAIE